MLIYKQELPMDTMLPLKVTLPFSSVAVAKKSVMKVGVQYDCPVMWYQADYETVELGGSTSGEPVGKEYIIAAIGTGHDWGDSLTRDHYIGTVLHYFIVDASDRADKASQEISKLYDIIEAMQQTENDDDE